MKVDTCDSASSVEKDIIKDRKLARGAARKANDSFQELTDALPIKQTASGIYV